MKLDYRSKLYRGKHGRLWRLADRLESTATAIRYANKPFDLVFPRTALLDLAYQIGTLQWEWLEEKMGLDKRDRGRWPHL